MKDPKVSIITVCYNSEKTIERTIRSVISQDYPETEYIIVDGMSTDGTIDIINKYRDRISKVISEKDSGIYDAMNKGIRNSGGDFLMFLNSDDYLFCENSLSVAMRHISNHRSQADVYFGNVLIYDDSNGKSNIWEASEASRFSLFRSTLPHPAMIYRHAAFERAGNFNLEYPIAADYEWNLRAYMKYGLRFARLPGLISVFSKGGISTIAETGKRIKVEKSRMREEHYSKVERMWYYSRWRIRKTLGI